MSPCSRRAGPRQYAAAWLRPDEDGLWLRPCDRGRLTDAFGVSITEAQREIDEHLEESDARVVFTSGEAAGGIHQIPFCLHPSVFTSLSGRSGTPLLPLTLS